jgi:hypothetical protein
MNVRNTPYSFYRYSIFRRDVLLTFSQQWDLLVDNLGREIAYRKSNPGELDKDTCIITPDKTTIAMNEANDKVGVLFFSIAKHIDTRMANMYNRESDSLSRETVPTDEYVVGNLVMIPSVGLVAASDGNSPEDLNAASSVGRFAAIIRSVADHKIEIASATTFSYLRTALKSWKLDEFSFTARPFNPSVRTPGDKLHHLLVDDNAKVSGKAKPNKGEHLRFSDEGWMSEVTGLADRGYGEYGAVGTTADGYHARIIKTAPDSKKPPIIKVYIPPKTSKEEHVQAVAITLLEIND